MGGDSGPFNEPAAGEHRILHWVHWLVLTASLALTLLAWRISSAQMEGKVKAQFRRLADREIATVIERLRKYENGLWGGVGVIRVNGGDISHGQWRKFSEALSLGARYPGIGGVGVVHHVPTSSLQDYLNEQRRVRPTFEVHPPHSKGIYLPITYIEPEGQNRKAVGLDVAHEHNRLTAALRARDTGSPQATGPIVLVQDTGKTPGFLLFVPFYKGGPPASVEERRRAFRGFVYAPFVVKRLMQGALADHTEQLAVRIEDDQRVLYDDTPNSSSQQGNLVPGWVLEHRVDVDVYGRTWTFTLKGSPAFVAAEASSTPLAILIGGLIVDGLLLALFLSLAGAHRRASATNQELQASVLELKHTKERLKLTQSEVLARGEQLNRQRRAALNIAADAKSAQRRSEELEQRARITVESTPNAMIMIDEAGLIVLVNAEAERLFRYSREQLVGSSVERLLPQRSRSDHPAMRSAFFANPVKRSMGASRDLFGVRSDGVEFPIEIGLNPITTSEGRFVLSAIVDNTERVRVANELRHRTAEMEELLYTVSHDLKSPPVTILGFSNLMLEELAEGSSPEARDSAQRVVRATKTMAALIDELLSLSRMCGEDEATEVDLNETLKGVQDQLDSQLTQGRIRLVVLELPTILAVPKRTHQIFLNLLGNAIKHGCPEGGATIEVGHRDGRQHHEFYVRDQGPGISSEYHERIFTMFKRLRAKDDGSGLGLAIVRKAARSMGGEAWVDSEPGLGSTFWFSISKHEASASPSKPQKDYRVAG